MQLWGGDLVCGEEGKEVEWEMWIHVLILHQSSWVALKISVASFPSFLPLLPFLVLQSPTWKMMMVKPPLALPLTWPFRQSALHIRCSLCCATALKSRRLISFVSLRVKVMCVTWAFRIQNLLYVSRVGFSKFLKTISTYQRGLSDWSLAYPRKFKFYIHIQVYELVAWVQKCPTHSSLLWIQ